MNKILIIIAVIVIGVGVYFLLKESNVFVENVSNEEGVIIDSDTSTFTESESSIAQVDTDTADNVENEVANNIQENESVAEGSVVGLWRWAITRYYNDSEVDIQPIKPEAFTLNFTNDGRVSMTTDCNKGSASYTLNGNKMTFSPIAATKMGCFGNTQEGEFFSTLSEVQSYSIKEGNQTLELTTDSGVMVFVISNQ